MINYYEILEISPKASKEIIEKSYKVLAKKYHPDLNPDNRKEAEKKIKLINEAYEVLSDDKKKENYDAVLRRKMEIESKRQMKNVDFSSDSAEYNSQENSGDGEVEYYTDEDSNFIFNGSQLDKKQKEKLQRKLQERYLEAYDEYLRSQGYRIRYKWTPRRIGKLLLSILVVVFMFTVLYFIPPINNFLHELYEENIAVKIIVDLIRAVFNAVMGIFR